MKQIVIISGKGGTGKTTLTSSIAYLSKQRNIADCDVEAPNLSLMLDYEEKDNRLYIEGKVAKIDTNKCTKCNLCIRTCRFSAIDENYNINSIKCEGCGSCEFVCPENAIEMSDEKTGRIYNGITDGGTFSFAELTIGADGAGKVVTEVRRAAMEDKENRDFILIDGSPGIGCVVIASLTGCDIAIVITEPTQSGMDDLKRILTLVNYFGIKAYIVINKYDLNMEKTRMIEEYCMGNNIEIAGKIPFDPLVNISIKESRPVVQYEESVAGRVIKKIWNKIKEWEMIK